jgi:hypothetical protein
MAQVSGLDTVATEPPGLLIERLGRCPWMVRTLDMWILSSESGLSRRSRHQSIFSMVRLALYDRRLQFRVYWTAQVTESSQRRLRRSLKAD